MTQLAPDDIQVGMYVTIFGGPAVNEPAQTGPLGNVTVEARTYEDKSYQGKVLRVKAIDLPFIVIEHSCESHVYASPTAVNFSKFKFKKLSDEYVKAMLKTTNP